MRWSLGCWAGEGRTNQNARLFSWAIDDHESLSGQQAIRAIEGECIGFAYTGLSNVFTWLPKIYSVSLLQL